ncbi:MAG: right-handed parallel beta-helix repeat-containing protein [Kiritimatiellales bacterium]|nr:right-handed parallel beta-helix repeat-containing protein [Kiritimatiellota bacterium]MBL7011812.1 right-handed parallel beta-helix repeat-containing protein [Kiritimatiellales bacterium]
MKRKLFVGVFAAGIGFFLLGAIAVDELTLGSGREDLSVYVPDGFTNRVEIYTTTNLISGVWSIVTQNLTPVSTNPATWESSLTASKAFFRAGNMDIDSDSDGLPDARELIVYKTNPDDSDTDNDGCLDAVEIGLGADPNDSDTDEDGLPDGWEVQNSLDPLDPTDALEDPDQDGFMNKYEYIHSSDPVSSNSIPLATRYVSLTGSNTPPFDTWESAANTIKAALDAATNDYEIILVADGTYPKSGNIPLDFAGKKLMLKSMNGPSNCIIDCGWGYPGLIFDDAETRETIVWGLQIYHAYSSWDLKTGGGIVCDNSGPTIENCIFNSNDPAVHATDSSILLNNCRFVDNEAYSATETGSAGFFSGGSPEVRNCQIFDGWGFAGGALSFTNVDMAVVSGCVISNNARGAMLAKNSTVIVEDCLITASDNQGQTFSAGAVFLNSDVTLSRCVFENNENEIGPISRTGGGLYLNNCTSVVENCLMDGNTSESGAIVFDGGQGWVQNCTIADNSGWGVYGISNAQITVRNTILWGNSGGALQTDIPADVAFCCTPSGEGENSVTNALVFVPGGYELAPVSSCIDRGTFDGAPMMDLLGSSRWDHPFRDNGVDQSDVDIGAFEFSDSSDDGDEIGDAWEIYWFGNTDALANSDDDNDGLNLLEEYQLVTSPLATDSDGDGLSDGDEVNVHYTDPLGTDSDGDGLSDGSEIITYGTFPANPDSDGDTMPDGWEVDASLSPTNATDAVGDADTDGLNNVGEYQQGTDPQNPDSDNDGLSDGDEIDHFSDPLNPDSDGDGLPDGYEVNTSNTDPADADSDDDGLSDGEEVDTYQTDPNEADTDGDGVDDPEEIDNNSSPLQASDNGEPNTYIQVRLGVGDTSLSYSEKWGLYIRPEERTTLSDPSNAVVSVANTEFGKASSVIAFLEKGKTYYYDMKHLESTQQKPDYDYFSYVNGRMASGTYEALNDSGFFIIDDYDDLLGFKYVDEFVETNNPTLKNNGTAPKTGKLTVPKVEFDNVWDRNLQHAEDSYPDYKKCIAIEHTLPSEVNLTNYLSIAPSSLTFDDIKDHVSFNIEHQIFGSASINNDSILDYDGLLGPDDVNIYAFGVQLLYGGCVVDRLIVVVYSSQSATEWNTWLTDADMGNAPGDNWLDELPPVYSALSTNNTDPEPANCAPQQWGEVNNSLPEYYHFNATFEMRSERTDGRHGHQACYNGSGVLIRPAGGNLEVLASSGTADFGHPSNRVAPLHLTTDVRPFLRAAQLDGNPVEGLGLLGSLIPENMSHPLVRIGPHLQDYYARRPAHATNTVAHNACCDPVECSAH